MHRAYWNNDNLKSLIIPADHITPKMNKDIDLEQLGNIIKIFKTICITYVIDLYIGNYPISSNYHDGYIDKKYSSKTSFKLANKDMINIINFLKTFSNENDIKYIDILEDFVDYENYSYDELHLNEKGSLKLATTLIEKLKYEI